jgi:hypothetical protein
MVCLMYVCTYVCLTGGYGAQNRATLEQDDACMQVGARGRAGVWVSGGIVHDGDKAGGWLERLLVRPIDWFGNLASYENSYPCRIVYLFTY